MILTHLVMFHFFTGAGGDASVVVPLRMIMGVGV